MNLTYIIAVVIAIYLIVYYFLKPTARLCARILVYPILIEVALMFVRMYSLNIDIVLGFIVYSFFTYYLLKKRSCKLSSYKIVILMFAGYIVIIDSNFFIGDLSRILFSLPDQIFHLAGVLVGYAFYKLRGTYRWSIVVVTSLICVYTAIWGYNYWLHKINFGTFSGNVENSFPSHKLVFQDSSGRMKEITGHKKILVLDFWFSRCGACFDAFPMFQNLYDTYRNNPHLNLYSINCYMPRFDKNLDVFKLIKEQGYNFPVLICKDSVLLADYKLERFPVMLVFNQKDELVYKGEIDGVKNVVNKLLVKH